MSKLDSSAERTEAYVQQLGVIEQQTESVRRQLKNGAFSHVSAVNCSGYKVYNA